jgi:tetratricopeptide (TPR) repeat protein
MTETPAELQRQGILALRQGRIDDGIAAFSSLLALEPNRPDDWYNLAYLQRCGRAFDDALSSYGQALDHGVGRPEEVHLNRAVILADHLDRTADALVDLERAIEISPDFVPAWLNLGNLHEDLGDRDAARSAYEGALRVDPGNGRAQARIAAIDVFDGDAEAAIRRLTPLVAASTNRPDDRVEMLFALGNALDAAGLYADAFGVIDAANQEARAIMPPELRYDRAAMETLIDAVIAAFPKAIPNAADDAHDAPIFLCGMFRSGSTLAEQILGRHSAVTTGGELEFLPALVQSRLQPYPAALGTLDAPTAAGLRDTYRRELHARFPDARYVTDKRPDNFLHIGLIKTMFPKARIVHTRRNALDNIVSVYFLYFGFGVQYGFALDDIAHWYGQYLRLMAHWAALYPGDIHPLDYDAVVASPREPVADLLIFCGLEWEEACLAQSPRQAPVRTASVWQVRQPLHTRSSGRWQNYREQLRPVAATLGITID